MTDQRFKRRLSLRKGLQTDMVSNHSTVDSLVLLHGIAKLAAAAGTSVAADTAALIGVIGEVVGATLTKTKNYIAGVQGMYSVTGTKGTTYPTGAVLAQISDGVSAADGAVVAYIDGDTLQTNAEAAFKVMSNNSVAASGFDYGVDLQDAAHDGYKAVDSAFYKKGLIRLAEDVIFMVGTTTPTDGTSGTGAGNAGPGSLHLNTSDAKLRTNTGTKASPTWTVVGAQTA